MAITINGSGTITGVSAGGLPDGSVTADDLASTLDISGKTVTLPSDVGGITTGKVLQVVNSSVTTNSSSNSSTAYDTGLTATITPSSTSSKILIFTDQSAFWNASTSPQNYADYGYLVRGSTTLCTIAGQHNNNTGQGFFAINFVAVDSPNTTSATTYKTQARSTNGDTLYINWDSQSRMTLIEVAG